MKTFSPLFATLILLVLAFGQACKKDADPREETNDRLNGDWEVSSLTVSGTEQIPNNYSSFKMEYDKESPFDGTTEWTLIGARSGQTEVAKGDYEVQDNGQEIDFEGDDLEVDFRDNDRLELEGVINGQRWVIRANRD